MILALLTVVLLGGATLLPAANALANDQSGAQASTQASTRATIPGTTSDPGAPTALPSDDSTIPSDPRLAATAPPEPTTSSPRVRSRTQSDPNGPPAPAPLRLMIAGDSISHEFAGDYTWRHRLWNEFHRQQVPVDFVGPRTGATGVIPLTLMPWADDQHDALGGTRLSIEVANIKDQVATFKPDVMLLMMGFNDLNHRDTQADVVANMRQYLENVWAAKADTRVVLSRILDTVVYPTTEPRTIPIAGTNEDYAALVQELRDQGRPISLADDTAPWVPRRFTVDGVHPTPTGETVIAQHYAESLYQLHILTEAPAIASRYVPWITPARATVTQEAGRVMHLTWDYYKSRLTIYQGRLRIVGGSLARPLITYGRTYTSSRDLRLGPGRYTVQLAPTRKWLIGRWGPPVAFTVR